jgi:formate dehydrogenase
MGKLGIRLPPHVGADAFMRLGPDGDLFGLRRGGLSRKKLLANNGTIKLADANPTGVLRKRLHTKDNLVHLEHPRFAGEVRRLTAAAPTGADHPLRLFTIREPRSQNSWLHNIPR